MYLLHGSHGTRISNIYFKLKELKVSLVSWILDMKAFGRIYLSFMHVAYNPFYCFNLIPITIFMCNFIKIRCFYLLFRYIKTFNFI